jgi:hypothetical protein
VLALGLNRQVVAPEPDHVVTRETIAIGVLAIRKRVEGVVGDGIKQKLVGYGRACAVSRHERDHGRQVAASAIAAYSQPGTIGLQHGGVVCNPDRRGVRILGSRWELVLRSQTIIDRHDQAASRVCQPPADRVVRIETPNHPAPAMKVDQDRKTAACDGRVNAQPQVPRQSGDHPLLHSGNRLGLAGRQSPSGNQGAPSLAH